MSKQKEVEIPAGEVADKAIEFLHNDGIMERMCNEGNKLYGPTNKILFIAICGSSIIDYFFESLCDLNEYAEEVILEVKIRIINSINASFEDKMEKLRLKSKRDRASASPQPEKGEL